MKVKIPNIASAGIEQLENNLLALVFEDLKLRESDCGNDHLVAEDRWKPSHPDIVHAYIDQLSRNSEYSTDKDIVCWLGLKASHAERRLRS